MEKKRFLVILLCLVLLVTYIPNTSYAKEKTPTIIYNLDNVKIEFKIVSEWESGFEGQFIITNMKPTELENLHFTISFKHEITSIWDGEIVSHNGDSYILSCPSWIDKINSQSVAKIGFIAKKYKNISIPDNVYIINGKENVESDNYSITYKITSDWGNAFNGEISILNKTNAIMKNWSLDFDFKHNIKQIWNASSFKKQPLYPYT